VASAGERGIRRLGDLRVGDPPAGVFVENGLRVLDAGPLIVADAVAGGADLRAIRVVIENRTLRLWQVVMTVLV